MFTYFITPFQCNYSLHNAKTFCTFFVLFFAILRCANLPTRAWAFQGSDFSPMFSVTATLIFVLFISSYKRQTWFFSFCIGPSMDPCQTTASWRSCVARPGTARGCVGCRNHKRFFRFPGFWAMSLNHTTYPAIIFCARLSSTEHFPLCLYQPIPTEF